MIEAALDIYEDDPTIKSSPRVQAIVDDVLRSLGRRMPAIIRRIAERVDP